MLSGVLMAGRSSTHELFVDVPNAKRRKVICYPDDLSFNTPSWVLVRVRLYASILTNFILGVSFFLLPSAPGASRS